MCAQRESASLWRWLKFYSYPNGKKKWKFIQFVREQGWRNRNFLQDTFWTPLNRIVGCKIFGHGKLKNIADQGEREILYCFKCYKEIKSNAAQKHSPPLLHL